MGLHSCPVELIFTYYVSIIVVEVKVSGPLQVKTVVEA